MGGNDTYWGIENIFTRANNRYIHRISQNMRQNNLYTI